MGRNKKMTEATIQQIYDWHAARRALGSTKVFAARLGLHPSTITHMISELGKKSPRKKGETHENNGRDALPGGVG